jgi:hypothetical protein
MILLTCVVPEKIVADPARIRPFFKEKKWLQRAAARPCPRRCECTVTNDYLSVNSPLKWPENFYVKYFLYIRI